MAVQGDVRDLDIPLLISTATFRRGVIEVDCPSMGTVMLYFQDGKVVSVVRNGEILENLLEVLDTLIGIMECRDGTFFMENLDGEDVEIPEILGFDANQLMLWVSSLRDEINHRRTGLTDGDFLRLIPERAKGVKDNLDAAFLLLSMGELVRGTTLGDLKRSLSLRSSTVDYFVSRLVAEGVLSVEREGKRKGREAKPVKVYILADDEEVKRTVEVVLKGMGYSPEFVEGGDPQPGMDLYVADLNGKGFLWANSLFGPFASRTVLVGTEDLKPARFAYVRKPLNAYALRSAFERILG